MEDIKAVVFDADGMIIKGEKFSDRFSRRYEVPIEKINGFFEAEFKNCTIGRADLKEVIKPYLREWKWTKSVGELFRFWFGESYHVDADVAEATGILRKRGIKCILATNQEKYRLTYMKQKMGLVRMFDEIICSCEVGAKKNERKFFDAIMKSMPEVKPSQVVFFDDRDSNLSVAGEFGFKAVKYTNLAEFKEVLKIG